MNYQTLLGVYHYCNQFHSGQASREYRVLCRVMQVLTVRGKDEYLDALEREGNEEAYEIFARLLSCRGEAKCVSAGQS